MRFDLAAMALRASNRRRASVDLRVIEPTQTLEDDLARLLIRPLRAIAEMVKAQLLPAYVEALARVTTDSIRDDVPSLSAELDGLDPMLKRLVLTLTPELRRWILSVEQYHRRKWTGAAFTATSVDLTTLIGPQDVAETLDVILARNVALVTDLGAEARGRLADAIWRGFQARSPAREVAKAIDEALQLGRKRALRIASHQTQLLSGALDRERAVQAGLEKYTWMHSMKLHPRLEHVARNGEVFRYDDPPDDGPPGTLPNCGCKARSLIEFT